MGAVHMSTFEPVRRPALKKSADGEVHPTLSSGLDAPDLTKRQGASTSDTLREPRGKKKITIDLPKPLHKTLKAQAKRQGVSVNELIVMLLEPPSR